MYNKQECWLYERRRKVTKLLLFAYSPIRDNRIHKKRLLKPFLSSVLHYLSSHLPRWEGRGGNFALTLTESHVPTKVFVCLILSLILIAFITFQFHVLSFLFRFLPQSYKASAGCFDLSPSTPSAPSQGVKGEGSNAAAFTQALQHRFNHTHTLCWKILPSPF